MLLMLAGFHCLQDETRHLGQADMDAHLIGIDLAHLIVKLKGPTEKQSAKAAANTQPPSNTKSARPEAH
jgi:hypothetical protein